MKRRSDPALSMCVGDDVVPVLAAGDAHAGTSGCPALLVLTDDAAAAVAWVKRAGLDCGRRVVVPTLPLAAPLARIVHAVRALLDELGLPVVDVYGAGRGAAAAHLFIRVYRTRVRRFVLDGVRLPDGRARSRASAAFAELGAMHDAYDVERPVEARGDVLLLCGRGARRAGNGARARARPVSRRARRRGHTAPPQHRRAHGARRGHRDVPLSAGA